MKSHTPGPWQIALGQLHGNGNRIGTVDDADTNAGLTREEAAANAMLIIAAPDLLEALKTVLENALQLRYDNLSAETIAKAEATIAKATGSQQ